MRLLILAACLLALASAPAVAGPNANGTLILHNPLIILCDDLPTFCGENPLSDCMSAVTRVDSSEFPGAIWKVYAAFPGESSPRLKGVTFGITYDPSVVITGYGPCPELELSESGWPASGTGTSLVWTNTQTGVLTEVYWFGGYAYYGQPGLLSLGINPDQGEGSFADDSVPSILDVISGYGTLGFYRDGSLVCPPPPLSGACCLPSGECVLASPTDCEVQGGGYVGGSCDPNPCAPTGACCFDAECWILLESECGAMGGLWMGPGVPCDPNPCAPPPPTPVREETWGRVKHQYR